MKTKSSLLILSFAAAVSLGGARAENAPAATAAERTLERAYLRADAAALAEAIKPLDAALAREPDNAALLYTRAFADYAGSALHRRTNDNAALQRCFESAASRLERVHGSPWEAEADALRGNILGSLISLQKDAALAGFTLGIQSSRLMNRAAKAAPASPRVAMFRGTSLLFTPADYGGDPVAGAKLLQQAVDRFAADDRTAPGPHWGQAEALAWLGFAKQNTGDLPGARAAWQQALAIEPDYAWVKFALLPSLDHKETQKK